MIDYDILKLEYRFNDALTNYSTAYLKLSPDFCEAQALEDAVSEAAEVTKDLLFNMDLRQQANNPIFSIFMKAVIQQNGMALKYVPEAQKTEDLCLEAVKQNGWALEFVPEAQKTEALCFIAAKQNGWALKFVPEEQRTEALCLAAVQQNGWAFKYVPKHMQVHLERYIQKIKHLAQCLFLTMHERANLT
jgi:hypothetical protein